MKPTSDVGGGKEFGMQVCISNPDTGIAESAIFAYQMTNYHTRSNLIKELGLICEINTRGIYKGRHADQYPGKWLIKEMRRLRIPVIVSTDAHTPEDLLCTEGAYEYLREIGYKDVLLTI